MCSAGARPTFALLGDNRRRPGADFVNMVNDLVSATVVSLDTVAVANRLRPVLLKIGRELRREARALGVSPGQVSLLVCIKHDPGIGVRELAAREHVSPAGISGHV